MNSSLSKCLRFFDSFAFLSLAANGAKRQPLAVHNLRTLGLKVRENVDRLWTSSLETSHEVNTFAVNSLQDYDYLTNQVHCRPKEGFAMRMASSASSQNCLQSKDMTGDPGFAMWSSEGSAERIKKGLYLFCPVHESLDYFHRLQRSRGIWWRNMANFPSNFVQSEVKENDTDCRHFSTTRLKCPYTGDEGLVVEKISYCFDEKEMKKMIPTKEDIPYHLICTESILDSAALALLLDGYLETKDNKRKLRLNDALAPYQVALVVDRSSPVDTKLPQFLSYLTKDLRKAGISFYFSDNRFESTEDQLEFHDCLGIPFTIMINSDLQNLGLVGLRSRDTNLEERLHVTRLKESLVFYLKLIAPSPKVAKKLAAPKEAVNE